MSRSSFYLDLDDPEVTPAGQAVTGPAESWGGAGACAYEVAELLGVVWKSPCKSASQQG